MTSSLEMNGGADLDMMNTIRKWLQSDQAAHGRHNLEELRFTILLLRIRMPLVLDLSCSRFTRPGRVD